ncbi:MAG: helix-turn-helix transcriptional regulator [Promethearchaeota archaeon]
MKLEVGMKINRTNMIILGILQNEPKNGYEIKKFAEFSTNLFWSKLEYGHIYPSLQSLLKQELIAVHEESTSDRGKTSTSYSITKKGILELDRWIDNGDSFESTKSETLAKLFFSSIDHVPLQIDRIKKLNARMEENMDNLLKQKGALEKQVNSMNPPNASSVYRLIVLEFGLNYYVGMKDLTEKSISLLKKLKKE